MAGVAQQVEHQIVALAVAGSSLVARPFDGAGRNIIYCFLFSRLCREWQWYFRAGSIFLSHQIYLIRISGNILFGLFKKKKHVRIDWLAVGLGNPGRKYENTRHNIGWMVVDEFAARHRKKIISGSRIHLEAVINIGGQNILAVKPTTFMNNSGEAVAKLSSKHEIPPEKIIVISDEYNFPVGKVHIRRGGGDGGHNGILSIIDELDTAEFYRLRCGIGKDFPQGGMVDYVLSEFRPEEAASKAEMISKAVDSIECMVEFQTGRAMSVINSGSLWKPKIEK